MGAAAVAALMAIIGLASGCGGSVPTNSSAAAPATIATRAAATPTSTSATTRSGRRCSIGTLALSFDARGAATGHRFYAIMLKNVGSRSCHLKGFPGVSLLDRNARQFGRPAQRARGSVTIKTVVLRPGRTASASLEDDSGSRCADRDRSPSAYVRVFPPGSRRALRVPTTELGMCPGERTLRIGPVVLGSPPPLVD